VNRGVRVWAHNWQDSRRTKHGLVIQRAHEAIGRAVPVSYRRVTPTPLVCN